MKYYIQDSRGYVGNCLSFWRPEGKGYTTNINDAGLFTKEEAERICKNRDSDIAWREDYIKSHTQLTVDSQYIDRAFKVMF